MIAFATVADLELRMGRTFAADELAMVDAYLLDASAFIQSQLDKYGIAVDIADEVQAQNLKKVCCSVTKRSLAPVLRGGQSEGFGYAPLSGYMQTAGAFSEQFTYANPQGDYYLTDSEKKSLGIGRMRMRSIPVHIEER